MRRSVERRILMQTNPERNTAGGPERPPTTDGFAFARRVLIATCVVMTVVLLLALVRYAKDLLMLVFAGILVSILLRRISGYLRKITGLGHSLALAIVTLALFGAIAVTGWLVAGRIASQANELTDRLRGALETVDDVRDAVKELYSAGFAPENIDIFVGEHGADMLDLAGEGHGTVTRRVRNFEALMVHPASDSNRRVDEALRAGGSAVAVLMDGKETMKEDVASLLKRHRAIMIRYWGRWTIESLD
jgi:hypothetical protein